MPKGGASGGSGGGGVAAVGAMHNSAVKTGMPGKGRPGGNPAVDGSGGEDETRSGIARNRS